MCRIVPERHNICPTVWLPALFILFVFRPYKTFKETQNMSKRNLSNVVKFAVEKYAFSYLIAIQKQKNKWKEIKYSHLALQPYFRPRENINLNSQRDIFALRTKINNIEANFSSTTEIKKCDKWSFITCFYAQDKK